MCAVRRKRREKKKAKKEEEEKRKEKTYKRITFRSSPHSMAAWGADADDRRSR